MPRRAVDSAYTQWRELFITARRHLPVAKRKARRIAKHTRRPVEIYYMPARLSGAWLLGVIYPDGHWSQP
jgi:hypothetical protein